MTEDTKAKPVSNNVKPVFKAPNFFRGNQFGKNMKQGAGAKFNPGTFKTQHKG